MPEAAPVDGSAPRAEPGPWAPLSQPTFRALWLAILVSSIGTWVQDVAAAWVIAERTGSAVLVAAVQAATTLPVVLLALIAGALADIVDRRRYLILAQFVMLAAVSATAALAHLDRLEPWTLIGLTFVAGVGAALAMPAQQATTPELVPRALLPAAVSLGSLSMNIARALGPALGGLVLAAAGAAWAFTLNALSFLGVIWVLWRWRREPAATRLPPETLGGALRAGLRYAAEAGALRAVLARAAGFFVFASAASALLPLVAQRELGVGPFAYGALLAAIGAGAVVGALLLPRLRRRVDRDALVLGASLVYALTMVALALLPRIEPLYPAMALAGFAWIAVLSSLQVAAQTAVPAWVRARALSLYIVVFAGGMAGGSLLWGAVAQRASTATALLAAAAGLALAALATRSFRLAGTEALNLVPSAHWPTPVTVAPVAGERGPVLITVEYRIAAADRDAFRTLLADLGRARRRDGALQWGVYEDTADPEVQIEVFLAASWLEHLRQHERVTEDDRALQERLRALHRGDAPPRVRHFVGGEPGAPIAPDPHPHADIGAPR